MKQTPFLALALLVYVGIFGGIYDPCLLYGQSYQLTVSTAGSGTVTSSPIGINCGTNCNATFANGTSVTLTINAEPGSYLNDINLDQSSGSLSIAILIWEVQGRPPITNLTGTVIMNQNTTLSVSFDEALIVTKIGSGDVSSSPSGLDCGFSCVGYFPPGQIVTLTATPAPGARFLGWSGDGSGIGNCILNMSQSHNVTATFTLGYYGLTINKQGSGLVTSSPAGIDCGTNCSADFPDGTGISLSINAPPGFYIDSLDENAHPGPIDQFEISVIFWNLMGSPPIVSFTNTLLMNQSKVVSVTFTSSISPIIIVQPQSQTNIAGATVSLNVAASGTQPLNYQWLKNGVSIWGANGPALTLNSVGAADSGGYSVVVWNAHGSITSTTASLIVLADGANGNAPSQISVPTVPGKPTNVDSLVVITHGFAWSASLADESWINQMADAIQQRVQANWSVIPYTWNGEAWGTPDLALINAAVQGAVYGQALGQLHYQHIHLIGHSAGAAFVEAAAKAIKAASPDTEIHCTFLDPYLSLLLVGANVYGANADWSDCYFVQDLTGTFTSGSLANAYDVDVTWVDPQKTIIPVPCASTTAESTPPVLDQICSYQAWSSHGYPINFYMGSVLGTNPPCTAGYGFPLSKEDGGWNNRSGYSPNGNNPLILCGPYSLGQGANPFQINSLFNFNAMPFGTSDSGANLLDTGSFSLNSIPSQLSPQMHTASGVIQSLDNTTNATGTPAWLAVALTITNAVNLVQFDAGFADTNSAEGLLTVYWSTNEIGIVDERAVSQDMQTYRFALPNTVMSGIYILSFRLDTFNNTSSTIVVTNVATGFVGITQPITLGMSSGTNGLTILQLTASSGFNYLIQTSTNLADWVPAALLVNTNGTVFYADPTWNNSETRFYRVLLPL